MGVTLLGRVALAALLSVWAMLRCTPSMAAPKIRQFPHVALDVSISPAEQPFKPIRNAIRKPNDFPMRGFQDEGRPAFGPGVVVDLYDVNAATRGNQCGRQIARTACMDSAQGALARGMTAARGPAHYSLDVALDSIQRDVEHETRNPFCLASRACSNVIVLRSVVSSAKEAPARMFA
jgi:hypothetical protein